MKTMLESTPRKAGSTVSFRRGLVWIKPNYIGDAVMATCLIDEMAKTCGRLAVRCGKVVRDLYADREDRLEFIEPVNLKRPAVLLRHARALRNMNLDAIVLVDRSFRSALVARLARVPVRVGHGTEGRGFLLSHSVSYDARKFEAACYLDLLRPLGLCCESAMPSLRVTAEERNAGAEAIAGCQVGLNPGGRHDFKHLPYETTLTVVKMLQTHGLRIALLGGEQDRRHVEALVRLGMAPDVDLVGKTSIREALGALSNLQLVFGSDSGLMHMAAAVGTPTVTVFGKEPASKWGYHEQPHCAIQAPNGRLDKVDPSQIFSRCISRLRA